MTGEISNGLAAILGALVGGLASLASTWVSERTRHKRDLLQREITKRETTYSDFIDHASKLYVMSATHNLNDDDATIESELDGAVSLYGIASRIRLLLIESLKRQKQSSTKYSSSLELKTSPSKNCVRRNSMRGIR
jgi:hypothetical protein